MKNKLDFGKFQNGFEKLYTLELKDENIERFERIYDAFCDIYNVPSEDKLFLFSAPGRTEVCGNHTDHQRGNVLAAGINLDVIAVVEPNDDMVIRVKSEGYDEDVVDLSDLSIKQDEINKSKSLIRGIAARFNQLGYDVKGFNATTTTNVLKGSGLSSSAAFEVLIGTIINELFCSGKETAISIAQIGQYAENVYFGKPSGLMDQMASSVGNIVTINFFDKENPIVKKLDVDFEKCGYKLCIIDAKGDHADLTSEYAAIAYEMKSVAEYFGKTVLSEVSEQEIYDNIAQLKEKISDRAVIRAIHFFEDDKRVAKEVEALQKGDFETFKQLVIQSGDSSYKYLQNIYAAQTPTKQEISVLLVVCEKLLKGKGAWRIHGGGFGGTVQAFVPSDYVKEFKTEIEKIGGEGTCHVLNIRPYGGTCLNNL